MRLSNFFTLDELTFSETAIRRGVSNTPTAQALGNLQALCLNLLDPLRLKFGVPVVVTSGYRSEQVNRLVRGAKNSQHCRGEAADIWVGGLTVGELFRAIRNSGLRFDQLIDESGWVHVSYSRARNRGELLRAVFGRGGTRYIPL